MALIGSESGRARGWLSPAAITARVREWLIDGSDRSLTQRMASAAFLIRVGSAAVIYFSQIALARWMGGHEFGIYVYVWTWVLLIGGLADVGLGVACQRFIPEYSERGEAALLRGFLSGSRRLSFGIGTAFAVVALGGVFLIEPWIDSEIVIPLYLAFLCLPFYALTNVLEGIARSYNWVQLGLLPPYIIRPILLLAVMAVAAVAGFEASATTAMSAAVIATWATAIIQMFLVKRRTASVIEKGVKRKAVGTWLATALPILIVEGFYLLLTYTDILVVELFRPQHEVAVYYAAGKTMALVAFVNFSVAAAAAHRFTAYHVNGDRERLAAFVADSIRWTFWPSLAAAAVILILGRPLLWMFGEGFADGYYLMFILAIGLLARAAIGPVERLLNMLGEQRLCATVYAVTFAVNLGLCLVLIPRMGLAGAAIAISTALVLESVLLFLGTKSRLGFHVFIWRGLRKPARQP